jgi:sporulation protein YlmC with PRC-barrel domain
MPHYGLLRDHKMADVDDVRGAEVYGVNDEKLGTIDDVIFDHSSGEIRYIVLKTGGLLSRRKVMILADRIEPYGEHEDKFYVDMDKERLEMLPEFKEETLKTEAAWAAYEKVYERLWTDSTIMYNKVTGRIITPPREEEIDFTAGIRRRPSEVMNPIGEEVEIPREDPGGRSQPIGEPGVYELDSVVETEQGAGPSEPLNINQGRRWDDFQQNLRVCLTRIVVECPRCASQEKAA